MKTYILYHANCSDGMGAAYAAWKRIGDTEDTSYIAVQYGNPPPEMEPLSSVYILDFSFDKETLMALKQKMARVIVIDHHKTAQEALEGVKDCIFDMSRSGAVLAWKFFHGDKPVPEILLAIEDRDLWKFQRPDTDYVMKGFAASSKDFREIDKYASDITVYNSLRSLGQSKDYFDQLVIKDSVFKSSVYKLPQDYRGLMPTQHNYAIANVTDLISEIGNHLCKTLDVDYSITFFITPDKVIFNLRSIGDFDVSAIAKHYGGGGHRNAAGYNMDFDDGFDHLQMLLGRSVKITTDNLPQFAKAA